VIPPDAELRIEHRADLLGGVTVIKGTALLVHRADERDKLYSTAASTEKIDFTAIPYYANANRAPSQMLVWIAEDLDKTER